jgi:hypothetical protein
MKRHLLCIAIIGTVLFAGHAGAVTFTQNEFTTAESLDPGMTQSGIHFSLSKDYKSYYPAIRYGLGGLFEVGVKFGVITNIKPDDKNGALAGADLKYQLIKQAEGVPLDMAVDLGFDNTFISGENVSELKFSTIFSRGFALTDRGYKLTPYGGLQVSALYGSYLPRNDTNYYIFGGLEWKISQKFMFILEVKTGEATVGGAGIRFEF